MTIDQNGGEIQAEESVYDDLLATFDELETGDSESETQEETEAEEIESEEVEEDNAETETEEDDEDSDDDQDGDDQEESDDETEAAKVEAPEHWSQKDREEFLALPDEMKGPYLEKVKSLESGYQQKFQELATERKALEGYKEIDTIFQPFQQDLIRAGLTQAQYVRNLISTAVQLRDNPKETLQALAQQAGVDLMAQEDPASQYEVDEYTDPAIKQLIEQNKALQDEIHGIKNQFDQTAQQQQASQQQQIAREWSTFTTSSDDQGNPLYPHAEDLRAYIASELSIHPEQPNETAQAAFKRAYEAVKWTNPQIRESILEAEKKAAAEALEVKKKENLRKKDLSKAKKNGRNIKSKSENVTDAPPEAGSHREEIERLWDSMI